MLEMRHSLYCSVKISVENFIHKKMMQIRLFSRNKMHIDYINISKLNTMVIKILLKYFGSSFTKKLTCRILSKILLLYFVLINNRWFTSNREFQVKLVFFLDEFEFRNPKRCYSKACQAVYDQKV